MEKTKKKIKIICVVGARPNFIKITPIIKEFTKHQNLITAKLIHTGQHYDSKMSKIFFDELEISQPNYNLGVGSDSHARQTAKIMEKFEPIVLKEKPNLILVVGDVNSTLACALVSAKLQVPVAHVEAGLRSFNWQMPEEINRVLTDRLSDFLFTTEESANRNLIKENIPKEKIFFIGNVMIDTLKNHLKKSQKSKILEKLKLKKRTYALLTLHRAEIVDQKENLYLIADILKLISQKIPIVFPVHPRTQQKIKEFELEEKFKMSNLIITEALGYLDFLNLQNNAKIVLTDSGGIQEETTLLKIPCLTLRQETERPVTVEVGTNIVTNLNKEKILKELNLIMKNKFKKGEIPPFWDGKAAQRIVRILIKKLKK